MRKIFLLMIITTAVAFSACKKSTEELDLIPISDYYPLTIGKYITYNLDSTVYVNFGQTMQVRSYQVKLQVDAQVTDNLGRPAYRIIRFIRPNAASAWTPDNTFMAVPTGSTMEFIENNLRFIKMARPIRNGYSWKGNRHIDTYSLNSELKYLADWDYTYDSLYAKTTLGAMTIDSTLKVAQCDRVDGNPGNPNFYSEINYSVEKYAKGIGLIFRQFLHTEYQPPAPGSPGPGKYADGSYGVKMTMIDHN